MSSITSIGVAPSFGGDVADLAALVLLVLLGVTARRPSSSPSVETIDIVELAGGGLAASSASCLRSRDRLNSLDPLVDRPFEDLAPDARQ